MTVEVVQSVSQAYIPNGTTTVFPFDFKVDSASEVIVVDANENPLSDALYNVTLNTNEGGIVTFLTAPLLADYPRIFVASNPDFTQEADFSNTGPSYDPETVERALDKGATHDIWLKDQLARSLKVSIGESSPNTTQGIADLLKPALGSSFQGDKGDPGGDATQVGTNAQIIGMSIASPIVRLQTTGYADHGDGGNAWYKRVANEPIHDGKLQDGDGSWWELDEAVVRPEMFGAIGDGVTNVGAQMQAAVDYAVEKVGFVEGTAGATYKVDDTIWFGNDAASSDIRGFIGNGATLIPAVNGKPFLDLVGVRNGRFRLEGWYIDDIAGDYRPECILALGRPKQASGVKSSGSFRISGNVVRAWTTAPIVRNAQSESNIWRDNTFHQNAIIGAVFGCTRHDYFEDTTTLALDEYTAGDFVAGDVVTSGGGATARILYLPARWTANTGGIFVHVLSGVFADNDTITGDGSGATATINMPEGIHVNGPVSTNPAAHGGRHVEEDSTSTYQVADANFFNDRNSTSVLPVAFISDFADFSIRETNFNSNRRDNGVASGIHLHIQQDNTKNPALGQSPSGFRESGNYFHSGHRYSATFFDPVAGGGSNWNNVRLGRPRDAGSPNSIQARYKNIGSTSGGDPVMVDWTIDSDFGVDLRGARARDVNIISSDMTHGAFWTDSEISGNLRINSDRAANVDITSAASGNHLTIHYIDTGDVVLPPEINRQIDMGGVVADRQNIRVTTAGAAPGNLDFIDLPDGMPARGVIRKVRNPTAAEPVTVVDSSRLRCIADIILDDADKSVTFEGVSGTGGAGDTVFRMIAKVE